MKINRDASWVAVDGDMAVVTLVCGMHRVGGHRDIGLRGQFKIAPRHHHALTENV